MLPAGAHVSGVFGRQDISGITPRAAAHFMYTDGGSGLDRFTGDFAKCICNFSYYFGFILGRKNIFEYLDID
tara:strand:+ start:1392 stop:1607 length:216 start_codon:yes stop_codon:yes gene_type:complete